MTMTYPTEPAVELLPVPFPDVAPDPAQPFPVLEHLSLRLKTYRHLLATQLAGPAGRRLLDLGSGPGHFARIAARQGFTVTAVDAREPWTLTGQSSKVPSRDYAFVRQDLRTFDRIDDFEVVALIGVLYHLTLEDQLAVLARCAGKTVIIDTELFDEAALPPDRRHRFTRRVTPQGYTGADCVERDAVYSSHLNPTSFWFEEASLTRCLADLGYTSIKIAEPAYRSAFGPRRWYLLHA